MIKNQTRFYNFRSETLVVDRPAKFLVITEIRKDKVVAKSAVKDNTSIKYCDICPIYGITISSVGPLYLLRTGANKLYNTYDLKASLYDIKLQEKRFLIQKES